MIKPGTTRRGFFGLSCGVVMIAAPVALLKLPKFDWYSDRLQDVVSGAMGMPKRLLFGGLREYKPKDVVVTIAGIRIKGYSSEETQADSTKFFDRYTWGKHGS